MTDSAIRHCLADKASQRVDFGRGLSLTLESIGKIHARHSQIVAVYLHNHKKKKHESKFIPVNRAKKHQRLIYQFFCFFTVRPLEN